MHIYLNKEYLDQIATTNHGMYTNFNNFNEILDILNIDKINSYERSSRNILSYQYLLIILIFLLISEWYIRNKIGLQ